MAANTDLVGKTFEEYFYAHFPGFINTTADKRVPDFYNPDHKFWVETKAGNRRWGPRIHEYQFTQSKELE